MKDCGPVMMVSLPVAEFYVFLYVVEVVVVEFVVDAFVVVATAVVTVVAVVVVVAVVFEDALMHSFVYIVVAVVAVVVVAVGFGMRCGHDEPVVVAGTSEIYKHKLI